MEQLTRICPVNEETSRKPKRFDVTSTLAYKKLYANNLRMYSFRMKKELDRRSQQKLQNRKEEYFQNYVTDQNNRRNTRLLKSFKQMSHMRTCLSELDLSRISDSESEIDSPQDSPTTPQMLSSSNEASARKCVTLDSRRLEPSDGRFVSRPRSRTALASVNYTSHAIKNQEDQAAMSYLRVPKTGAEILSVSPLASPTSTIRCIVTPPLSPDTPPRRRFITRRYFSDLDHTSSSHQLQNPELGSDSDEVTHSDDGEPHISGDDANNNDAQCKSPSLNRLRQAKLRFEYRKERLASLEGTISKADSILKDFKRKSLPRKISEDNTKLSVQNCVQKSLSSP
eukprot:gene11957-13194_t